VVDSCADVGRCCVNPQEVVGAWAPDLIIVSPLTRALQTCCHAFAHTDTPIQVRRHHPSCQPSGDVLDTLQSVDMPANALRPPSTRIAQPQRTQCARGSYALTRGTQVHPGVTESSGHSVHAVHTHSHVARRCTRA
jgi:hypothetical protein